MICTAPWSRIWLTGFPHQCSFPHITVGSVIFRSVFGKTCLPFIPGASNLYSESVPVSQIWENIADHPWLIWVMCVWGLEGERQRERERRILAVKYIVSHLAKTRSKRKTKRAFQRDHLFIICAYMIWQSHFPKLY